MTQCPVEDCKEKQDEIYEIIFKDSDGGLRYDMRKKVSWTALSSIVAIVVTLLGIVVGMELHSRDAICAIYDARLIENQRAIKEVSVIQNEVVGNQKVVMAELILIKESLKRLEDRK